MSQGVPRTTDTKPGMATANVRSEGSASTVREKLNSTQLPRHATECPGRNPEAPPQTPPDPGHQNVPDRARPENLSTLHLPRVQTLPARVRQESHRSCHLSNLPLWIPVRNVPKQDHRM